MSDASCPFCGTSIISTVHPAHATCCLASYGFTNEQWNMRPPKKEQPAQTVVSEVEYLRRLVRDLVIEEKPEVVTQYIYPLEGTGPEVVK